MSVNQKLTNKQLAAEGFKRVDNGRNVHLDNKVKESNAKDKERK